MRRTLVGLAVVAVAAGCGFGGAGSSQVLSLGGIAGTGSNGQGGPSGLPGDPSNPIVAATNDTTIPLSYVADIQPILAAHCTSCHGPGGSQAMSPLNDWSAVSLGSSQFGFTPSSYVSPGSSEASLLVAKVLGRAGMIMPPTGPLPASDIQKIVDWIEQGARNSLAGVPTRLQIASGNNQSGTVNADLGQPLAVSVTDGAGAGVGNVTISFAVQSGTGTLSASTATTNGSGVASVRLRPDQPGTITVSAGTPGLATVTFTATATSPNAPTMSILSGNNQSGAVGAQLANPLVIAVRRPDSTAATGITVTFAVTGGGGRLSATSAVTDGSGNASVTYTLGNGAGANTIVASASGVNASPQTLRATGNAGPVSRLTIVSGNGQTGSGGMALVNPLTVRATDAFGNAAPNVAVVFAVTSGTATSSVANGRTAANGTLATVVTVGATPGAIQVRASAGALMVNFDLTATAAVVRSYTDDVAPLLNQKCVSCHGPGGSQQSTPLNSFTNVVNGTSRRGYQPSRFVTAGLPGSSLLLAKVIGTASGGGIMPPSGSGFIAPAEVQLVSEWIQQGARQSTNGPAATIQLTSGDGQSAPAGSLLPGALVVTVRDAQNRPVPGYSVAFLRSDVNGRLSASSVVTDGVGRAAVTYTLSTTVGSQEVDAVGNGLTGSPIIFGETATPSTFTGVPLAGSTNPLDQAALAGLQAYQVEPGVLADDSEFVRRVTADLLGRLPTEAEATAFLVDTDPQKRVNKVNALLATIEFARHWARDVIQPWTRTPPVVTVLDTAGVAVIATYMVDNALVTAIDTDVPLREVVRRFAEGDQEEGLGFAAFWSQTEPTYQAEVLVGSFAGQSVQCSRCHDHPLTTPQDDPRLLQDDVYGLYAFFATNTTQARKRDRTGARFGTPVEPNFVLDGYPGVAPIVSLGTPLAQRRARFAQLFTASHAFTRGTAHRIWGEVARPLLNPDEFLAATLAAVRSPAFLEALSTEFIAQNTSLKGFLRSIMSSRVYQLSSQGTTTANDDLLARYALRRHHSEVLEAGNSTVCGLAPPVNPNGTFQANFGYPTRTTFSNTNRTDAVNLAQAFVQLNSTIAVNGRATNGGANLGALAVEVDAGRMTTQQAVNTICRAALARDPVGNELSAILAAYSASPGTTRQKLEDVACALALTSEFLHR